MTPVVLDVIIANTYFSYLYVFVARADSIHLYLVFAKVDSSNIVAIMLRSTLLM